MMLGRRRRRKELSVQAMMRDWIELWMRAAPELWRERPFADRQRMEFFMALFVPGYEEFIISGHFKIF